MDYTIRLMKKKDIPQVQRVAKVSWNDTYEGIIPLEIQNNFLKRAYSYKTLKRKLKYSVVLVAEIHGKIVGFANYSRVSAEGSTQLGAIYVFPEFQGYGIGSAFLKEGVKILDDVKEIQLNVEKRNSVGRRFYQARGFEKISETEEDFNGHTIHTINMKLKIKEKMNA